MKSPSEAPNQIVARPRVTVILLTLDQRQKTLRCLASLELVTEPDHRVLLWDNGSEDGTCDAVRELYPEVLVHHHPTNLGVASGRNAAVGLALKDLEPRFLLFIDNDMEVTPGLLSALLEPFGTDPRIGQTTGKIAFLGEGQRLYGAGGCYVRFWLGQTGHVGYGELDRGQYDVARPCLPSGGCMMVPTELFERLGGFDTAFDPYGPEDLDFGFRVREVGLHGFYVPQALIFHEPLPGKTLDPAGMKSESYVRTKTRFFLQLMRRHAPWWQRLAFVLVGAPVGVLRIAVREGRRGNVRALKGLAAGLKDLLKGRGAR